MKQKDFWEKGDRVLVLAAGGAFLGRHIAHLLSGGDFVMIGAILGAIAAAIYGWTISA